MSLSIKFATKANQYEPGEKSKTKQNLKTNVDLISYPYPFLNYVTVSKFFNLSKVQFPFL